MGFVAVVADSIGRRVNMAGNFGVSGYAAADRNRYVAVYLRSCYQAEKEYVRRVGPVGSSASVFPRCGGLFLSHDGLSRKNRYIGPLKGSSEGGPVNGLKEIYEKKNILFVAGGRSVAFLRECPREADGACVAGGKMAILFG